MAQSAIMRYFRKRMKAIFWITAIVFIGLIVFGWGMDITGSRGRSKMTQDIAGKVGNYKITMQMYREAVEREFERAYSENRAVTESDAEIINDRAWFALVNRWIAREQMESKGVDKLTDKEVFEAARMNPPDIIKQHQAFQKDGKFDQSLYEAALRNPEIPWGDLEDYIRNNFPFDRLKIIVNAMPIITELEAKDEYAFRNDNARASYIKIDPYSLEKVEIDTSDAAIAGYYEKNKDKYKMKESVVLNYAKLVILPTSADTAAARAEAESMKVRIDRGEDFAELASYYSDDVQTKKNGGAIGWLRKSAEPNPFEEAAFKADSGEIVGPILTNVGFHIIKVDGKHGEGDSLMVKASHILLTIEPIAATEDSVKKAMNDLVQEVRDGKDFFETAKSLGIDSVGQSAPIERRGTVPGVGYRGKVDWWIFADTIGAIETVPVKLRDFPPLDGWTVLQIVGRNPEGVPPLTAIRKQVVTDIIMQSRKDAALALIKKAESLIDGGMDMAKAAKTIGAKLDTTGTFQRHGWIQGVGDDPVFKGTAFGLITPGNLSEPFLGEDGSAYIVRLDSFTPADMTQYYQQRIQIKNEVLGIYRQNFYDMWFAHVREKAGVFDNRYYESKGREGTAQNMPDVDY